MKAHLQAHDEGSLEKKEKVSKKKRKSRSKKVAPIHAAPPKDDSKNTSNGSKEISYMPDMKKVIKEEEEKSVNDEKKEKEEETKKSEKTEENPKEELETVLYEKIEIWKKMHTKIQIRRKKENTKKQEKSRDKNMTDAEKAETDSQFADKEATTATFHSDKDIGCLEGLLLQEETKLAKADLKGANMNAAALQQEETDLIPNSVENGDLDDRSDSRAKQSDHLCCSFCGRAFSQIGNLHRHEDIRHKGVRLQCDKCLEMFKDKKTLLKHGWKHDDPRLQCNDCGIRFKHPDTLRNHIRVVHENLQSLLTCQTCKKDFRNKDTLRLHKRNVHDRENKAQDSYPCEQCGKIKKSIKLLQDHTKTHNQCFPCQTCGKRYKALRSLRDHTLAQHPRLEGNEGKEFSCDQCGKKKASESLLKVHMKLHNQFFPCLQCGQIRKSSRSLKFHSSSHHGTAV